MATNLCFYNRQSISPALEFFDKLPDSAHVPIAVVCGIYSCSTATIWRRVKTGEIIQPIKLGKRTTRWQVGMLRDSLEQEKSTNAISGGKA